jgi:hypothetical protein
MRPRGRPRLIEHVHVPEHVDDHVHVHVHVNVTVVVAVHALGHVHDQAWTCTCTASVSPVMSKLHVALPLSSRTC